MKHIKLYEEYKNKYHQKVLKDLYELPDKFNIRVKNEIEYNELIKWFKDQHVTYCYGTNEPLSKVKYNKGIKYLCYNYYEDMSLGLSTLAPKQYPVFNFDDIIDFKYDFIKNNEIDPFEEEDWGIKSKTNENILPKPYKKVKCAECGEDVCDNINYKIGHLYNKHNCKPSVDDYKAKRMLREYFPI